MKVIKIDKNSWTKGIDKSREAYKLFGPVKDKTIVIFKELEQGMFPEMEYTDSVLSAKSVIFPQTEKILGGSLDESIEDHHILKRPDTNYSPRAVLGIRPYDAKAIQLVKLNFDTEDYRDPYWCDAYEATTFIGLAINEPSAFDFSTLTDTGPFGEEGLDILLVDCKEEYLAKVLTDKGETFLKASGFEESANTKPSLKTIKALQSKAEKAITSKIDSSKIKDKTILELYEAPFWDDLAFSCINCGTCTYVCPTCWCFDIQDETRGKTCSRFRNWDTCMDPLFTMHGSGHNPRGEKTQRVRQRFMHKLKYFLDKYDKGIMCVGCGRCVKHCPVNIDIREVCNTMNSYEKQE
ncbi:MAG: 4Fe-4S dicluster domain-containing protein [Desulfobacterales bacterium]|nr:4Fe-4S dicluster domain-containing protein [Desulfobacterales bacterium]